MKLNKHQKEAWLFLSCLLIGGSSWIGMIFFDVALPTVKQTFGFCSCGILSILSIICLLLFVIGGIEFHD